MAKMNGSLLLVYKCRVTELIIAIRMFLCSEETDKAKVEENILSRCRQLCKVPGGQQHIS